MKLISLSLLLLFFSNTSLFSAFGGGTGVSTDPYKISTLEHLLELSDSVVNAPNFRDKHFILMNDITDSLRVPIGYRQHGLSVRIFRGSFNGQGHSINLAIEDFDTGGLFCEIANTTIMNVVINGYVREIRWNSAGGVVGKISQNSTEPSKIIGCVNNAYISAVGFAGGIIGWANHKVIVENCINLGTVKITYNVPFVIANRGYGGILGADFAFNFGGASSILNSVNYGFINGGGHNTGGILGHSVNGTTLSNNFNGGVVIGNDNVGCILGFGGSNTILLNNHYDKQMCGEED